MTKKFFWTATCIVIGVGLIVALAWLEIGPFKFQTACEKLKSVTSNVGPKLTEKQCRQTLDDINWINPR